MRFRTKEEIQQNIAFLWSRGLSIAACCKRENIHPNTFYQWRNRLYNQKWGITEVGTGASVGPATSVAAPATAQVSAGMFRKASI